MQREARVNNRLEQDKKVRQNQISELIKIFEEDQIQTDIAQQFSNQLEQAAFELSGGENTREYRTRLNTVKIRLNGTKGQFIRQVLLQSIMTPLELMAFDMSKLNENTIQAFLEQNNRQFPQKNVSNRLGSRIVVDKDLTQNSNEKPKESNNDLQINSQQEEKEQANADNFNQLVQNKPTEFNVPEVKQQHIDQPQQTSTITETEKIDFAPQEEPIQQFEEYVDYSFEYNQKQRDFVEGNDFPNIEELQINEIKQNNLQDDLIANSPLPSDNVLNQEFLQDDPLVDGPKENAQTKILDSQIQEEEQQYYEHECSFQIKEQQLIDAKIQNEIIDPQADHPLAEFAVQTSDQKDNFQQEQQNHIQNFKQETNHIHTHNFEQQIYQKVMDQHTQQNFKDIKQQKEESTEQLPQNYEEFFQFIEKRDKQFENQINQLIDQNKTLTEQFYKVQIENQVQQENLEIQNLNYQNRIQQLINENNILKLSFQQNEQQQQQSLAHLKEQSLIEKAQFQQVYQSQLSTQQKHKEFLEQIKFNLDFRRDAVLKIQQSSQSSVNLEDEIGQMQDILAKQNVFENNYQVNTQTNEIQTFNQQFWASENDAQTIGTMVNADSGSTQIRRNKEALNTEVQEEVEQFQVQSEAQNFGETNQTRVVQQTGENTSFKNSLQEQTNSEKEQQIRDQVQNKRTNNIKQTDQDVQGLKNGEDQGLQEQQQFSQIKNNHNKGSEVQMNQLKKRQQVKRSNVPESVFD
ncbi:unnamed protein product (macronuclear) [Paramecium tetraurelia]|uniref:TFIIS central domain-containing protein n=1 Tax=Paramecium tetraurelia TaxID=5888 RepID=A0E8W9_PARTE|nr:uncharacterized protein GSPATT00024467001 [Paramecium tetraurelia]CAK91736.1 unnamed protein product [Paramecium tetraurelia]|eukprot:XP_001459133.1 hypothetical protein (macronuclear) [Paramecium tetraurelia strain d4-2]